MEFIESVWYMLILIGVMIVIHELGHYWAGLFFDVKIEAFSFGFGPRLFGIKRGETDFKVCALPLGGYVKFSGDLPGEPGSDDPRSLLNKPRWQRMIVAFAGPFMNIILAIGIMTGLLMNHHEREAAADQPARIGYVAPDSPAAKGGVQAGDLVIKAGTQDNPTWSDVRLASMSYVNEPLPLVVERGGSTRVLHVTPGMDERAGMPIVGWEPKTAVLIDRVDEKMDAAKQGLQAGDQFVSINGVTVDAVSRVHELVRGSEGKPLQVVYRRGGKDILATVTPTFNKPADTPKGRYMIGIAMTVPTVTVKLGLGAAFQQSLTENRKFAGLLYSTLQGIVTARVSAKSLEGPIGIARVARREAKQGLLSFVSLMAMVSLNLAVFNLLPIPILDGGVMLLLAIEMIFRRDLSMQVKEMIFRVGFVFLMFLVVFVFYNDIAKLIPRG